MVQRATLAAIVVGCLALAGSAPAASWKPFTTGKQGNSDVIGVARTADGVLHVAWVRRGAPNSDSLMHTAISPGAKLAPANTILTGWNGVGSPALLAVPGGGLRVFFGGIRTTDVNDT